MRRTITKTASYSVMHMTVAIAVAYALSGSWVVALSIGIVEPLVQTVAYHFHEQVWARFGRHNDQQDPRPAGMRIPGHAHAA